MQLTDDEIKEIADWFSMLPNSVQVTQFARAIESALSAQADARPFGWWYSDKTGDHFSKRGPDSYAPGHLSEYDVKVTPLYTHPEASAQPMCVKCGDGIMAHDPGTCGNCHAMGAEASAPGLSDERAEQLVREVETAVGMNREAWDCIDAKEIVLATLTRASAATVAEPSDQFERLDLQNHQLRRAMQKIMARLTELLDEDKFAEMEQIAKSAGVEPPAAQQQAEPSKYPLAQGYPFYGDGGDDEFFGQQADSVCEHEWKPMQEPHKECVKCGDVRRDWGGQQAEPGADERAAFEAWFDEWFAPSTEPEITFKRDVDDDYIEWDVQCAWRGWEKRASQSGQRAGVAADDLPTLTGALGTFEFGIQWDGIGEPSFMIVNGHFMGGSGFLTYPRMLQSVAKFVQDYAVTYDARNPIAAAPTQQQETNK